MFLLLFAFTSCCLFACLFKEEWEKNKVQWVGKWQEIRREKKHDQNIVYEEKFFNKKVKHNVKFPNFRMAMLAV